VVSRRTWVWTSAAIACVAFALGVTVGRSKKVEIEPRQPAESAKLKKRKSDRVPVLLASVRNLRRELAEKERRTQDLETELVEVQARLLPLLSPQQLEEYRQWQEEQKEDQRHADFKFRVQLLRDKIIQRQDPVLRQEGLEELASLVQSDNADDVLLGLRTLGWLDSMDFDRDRFKPHVLACLTHEKAEIRGSAQTLLGMFCTKEEALNLVLRMVSDPSHHVRASTASHLGFFSGSERNEEVATALTALLQDEDNSVRLCAVDSISRGYDYGDEMEDLVIQVLKDPDRTLQLNAFLWLANRKPLTPKIAQCFVDMINNNWDEAVIMSCLRENAGALADDAAPIITPLCLRVLRDSLLPPPRCDALRVLRTIGDTSVLPKLQQIALGPDAQGIEEELAETIQHLQQ